MKNLIEPHYTVEWQECEDYFPETITRDKSSRFIEKIPFTLHHRELGNSKEFAINQFYSIEKRLQRNAFKRNVPEVNSWIYRSRSHSMKQAYVEAFLPHHLVLRESNETRKLRIVFNVSLKSNMLPLNNVQRGWSNNLLKFTFNFDSVQAT